MGSETEISKPENEYNENKIIEEYKSRLLQITNDIIHQYDDFLKAKKIPNELLTFFEKSKNRICEQIEKENNKLKEFLQNQKKKEEEKNIPETGLKRPLNKNKNKQVEPIAKELYDELDYFTPREIQKEYQKLIIKFRKKALNQINDKDNIPNKSVAFFLRDIANISRDAYRESDNIFNCQIKEFQKSTTCVNMDNEQMRNKFSAWVKHSEKINLHLYDDLKKRKIDSCSKKEDLISYFQELFYQLSILYFHCALSYPKIEINFSLINKTFDHETMKDLIDNGRGNVHFVYLPSLFCNENYLEDGKLWVYTCNNKSYSFPADIINKLNKIKTHK